jgi:branched-chain amino acid aminotransferase
MAPNTFPSLSKTSGNYANAALIRMEAEANGYSEGIALDTFGYVSEGSGENIFIVRNGIVHTPPLSASILPGITRDMVVQIAEDLGYRVAQENIPREMLYIADEVFFAGTAVELTPVRSVDKIVVGGGRRGPVTEAIQRRFLDIINGSAPDTHGWLSYLPQTVAVGRK